jgi:uncharacterized protein (TIGR03084 family)
MEEIVAALSDQQAEMAGLLLDRDAEAWLSPTPCEGWNVADVVLHLAQTDELAVASVRGTFGATIDAFTTGLGAAGDVDEGAAAMVARERDRPASEIRARWQAVADDLHELLLTADPHRRVPWVAGNLSIHTLAATRLSETWIHTGDVAAAFGVTLRPTDRLRHVARLAWRTLPYAFGRAGRTLQGPVAFELRGPDGVAWDLVPDSEPQTVVRGDGVELCLVAARRVAPEATGLRAEGPDGAAVLELVRTYA